MGASNHTATFDELGMLPDAAARLASWLQRASAADLMQQLTLRGIVGLEADMMRKAHAMLHGDVEAADHWLMEGAVALDYETLSDREHALRGLVDAAAETCAA